MPSYWWWQCVDGNGRNGLHGPKMAGIGGDAGWLREIEPGTESSDGLGLVSWAVNCKLSFAKF